MNTPQPGNTVPFAVTFDRQGNVLVAETGAKGLASFELKDDGILAQLDLVETEQAATCWVAPAGGFFYTSNAGSASLTGFSSSQKGQLTRLGNTHTDPGTVDASATDHYLYVQAGKEGKVDEFALGEHGALKSLGSVTVPNAAGGEGIVAG